jgi:hypothetical protein
MYDPITGHISYTSTNAGDNFIVNTPGGQLTGRLMQIGVQAVAQMWLNGQQTTIRNQQIGNTNWFNIQ